MPVKRRLTKRRLDQLTLNQKMHLETGSCFFCLAASRECEGFEDGDHRRALWEEHRQAILAEWRQPERMPAAFWEFDRRWPKGAESESHATWLLPQTSAERRAKIEAYWSRWVAIVLHQATDMYSDCCRQHALQSYGVPSWFWDKHAPAVRAKIEMDHARFRAGSDAPGLMNGHG